MVLRATTGCVIDLGIHLVDAALWILGSTVTHTESRLFHRGKRLTHFGEACEDYAIAHIDLASGAVLDIGCSWHLHAGRNAVIRMAFYGAHGAVALENRKGSFFDFVTEKYSRTSSVTLCRPPDGWPGRAAVEWVRRLAQSNAYDPEIEQMITVAKTLDDIYRSAFDRAENRGG